MAKTTGSKSENSMKRSGEIREKQNIWKWIAIGSVAAVGIFCLAAGVLMYHIDTKEQILATYDEAKVEIETDAYLAEETLAEGMPVRRFLDQEAPEAEEGDNRDVFRIIEVIPHEVCSIFPYYIDWKTPEGYDENTPLGYDGLLVAAQIANTGTGGSSGVNMFSSQNTKAIDSRPYTYIEEIQIKEYFDNLSDYTGFTGNDNKKGARWFRKTKDENALLESEYGYFEYVGENNGLFYISASSVAGMNNLNNGIHFEIQAVCREGTEDPKGYIYVQDPAYYWSKDSAGSSMPNYVVDGTQKPVLGVTKYNYDLKFAKETDGNYIVENYVCNLTGGEEFEYDIMLEDSAVNTWLSGFSFREGGNYQVKSYLRNDTTGQYVRFATNDGVSDGLEENDANLAAGYFLLDETNSYQDVPRYNVSFEASPDGTVGFYMPNTPASTASLNDYYFVYKGNNQGTYKVSFLYAPSETTQTQYMAEIVEVSNNQGRYALTTTSTSGTNQEPIYSKTENVTGAVYDYAEVITYIDAWSGIHAQRYDYKVGVGGMTGVINGGSWSVSAGEVGGWVYVPLESESEMEQTFLRDVQKDTAGIVSNTDAYFQPGDRIYVTGQKRPYRFYCQDGLQNNEWFKLLCYSNNPMDPEGNTPYSTMVDGVGYDFEKTVEENMTNEVTKQLLDAFDGQFRIEIIQKQPQNLTVEDVMSADLIYISNQSGIRGMNLLWNEISDSIYDESLPHYPESYGNCYPLSPEQDISAEVLRVLYDECIYERNRALIVCYSVIETLEEREGDYITRNLTKLYYMMDYFDDSLTWAYFMPDFYPEVANEDYSRIRLVDGEMTVDTYVDKKYGTYNVEFPDSEDEEITEDDIAEYEGERGKYQFNQVNWLRKYFWVLKDPSTGAWEHIYSFQNDVFHWANQVRNEETKMTIAYYLDPLFSQGNELHRNIWQILRNRRLDTSVLVVEVTNAEKTAEAVPRNIIYADELDPESFDIDYKVMLLGTPKKPSSLTDITLTFEDGSSAGYGAILEYGVENTNNVRHGFTQDHTTNGLLNPSVTMRKVIITATDSNGKEGTAEVYVVVREAFMLN